MKKVCEKMKKNFFWKGSFYKIANKTLTFPSLIAVKIYHLNIKP